MIDTPETPMKVLQERPHHAAAIDALIADSFGPDRLKKTVYRLRDGVDAVADLCIVAEDQDGALRGSLRFWPVLAGGRPALLLGPLAVIGGLRKTGVGTQLMREGLARAKAAGWQSVLLVGDEAYYARFGFQRRLAEALTLPGPVDLTRFLALELSEGALQGASGMIEPFAGGVPCRDRSKASRTAAGQLPDAAEGARDIYSQKTAGLD